MFEAIPDELKSRKQWIVWKLEIVGDRLTKVPYQADSVGKKASSTSQYTWTTFDNAVFAYENEKCYSGVGFVFSKSDPFIGIDFDKCIDKETGLMHPSIEQDVLSLCTYTEISQSGTGLHAIGCGEIPTVDGKGCKKGNFEMYSSARYFAITGNVYPDFPKTICEIPNEALAALYNKYLLDIPSATKPATRSEFKSRNNLFLGDEEILVMCEHSKNSSKFTRLWAGQTSPYPSQSEAELALCCILAFYTKDKFQLQRLLTHSGLYRKKMDRVDYINETIEKSLSLVRESYDPKAQIRGRWLQRRLVTGGDRTV